MGLGNPGSFDEPMTKSSTDTSCTLVKLAVEYWRLLRAYDRIRADVGAEAGSRFAAQSRFALMKLDALLNEAGFRLAIFDGQPFYAGLPVRALNAEDFVEEDGLIIAYTNEPTILVEGRVVALGTVTLERRVEGAS